MHHPQPAIISGDNTVMKKSMLAAAFVAMAAVALAPAAMAGQGHDHGKGENEEHAKMETQTSARSDRTVGRFGGTGRSMVAIGVSFAGTRASCGVTSVTGVDTIGQRQPDPAAVDASRGLPLNA